MRSGSNLPHALNPALTRVASSEGTLLRLAANSDLSSKAFHTAAVDSEAAPNTA